MTIDRYVQKPISFARLACSKYTDMPSLICKPSVYQLAIRRIFNAAGQSADSKMGLASARDKDFLYRTLVERSDECHGCENKRQLQIIAL